MLTFLRAWFASLEAVHLRPLYYTQTAVTRWLTQIGVLTLLIGFQSTGVDRVWVDHDSFLAKVCISGLFQRTARALERRVTAATIAKRLCLLKECQQPAGHRQDWVQAVWPEVRRGLCRQPAGERPLPSGGSLLQQTA